MSGPDLSRMLTRVMRQLESDPALRVEMFDAYQKSDDTDDWPEPLRLAFDKVAAQM